MPYTSFNGHMFSFLTNTGKLALRLPTTGREVFLKKYKTTLCEQHGTVMKEYVVVPDHLLKKPREIVRYFQLSFAYVGSLKPKATTKKATTTKRSDKKVTRKKGAKKKTPLKSGSDDGLTALPIHTGGNMTRITVTRTINAPVDIVFRTVADIREFAKALPHVVDYEFLSERPSGVGTRFRETRLMNGKKATTELEVTEYVENDHVRMVADSHGTVWDTTFRVSSEDRDAILTMTMDAKAYKLMPKLMNPLVKGMIQKAVERDMDLVKSFCEHRDQ